MKKIITLLVILIAFCELKAQNKQLEFNVEKPNSDINLTFEEDYMINKRKSVLQFTAKQKHKKYRFTFTHGTIEQKDAMLYVVPNKTGEGIIKVYEVNGKKNSLVKEMTIDVYEKPMYCFGEICFSYKDEINDLIILNHPFIIKLKNETKELNYVVKGLKLLWVCNEIITEVKVTGNLIDKTQLDLIVKGCNSVDLYFEDIKIDDNENLRNYPLILKYSKPKTELK